MKVTAKKTVHLEVHPEEFDISFAWNKKAGVDKDYWFTPTGKCKIWCMALNTETLGVVTPTVYKKLVKQLKANNTELFIWGSTYYCVMNNDSIAEVRNMATILYQAKKEWEDRKYQEFWVEDQREMV